MKAWKRTALWLCLLWLAGMNLAQEPTPIPAGFTIHVVQRGETLFRIALAYNITYERLAEINGLSNPNSIQAGLRLLIPADSSGSVPIVESEVNAATPQLHTVVAGETLFLIGQRYGVTVNALMQANTIVDPSLVFAGQTLIIPSNEAGLAASQSLPPPLTTIALRPALFTEGQTASIRILSNVATTLQLQWLGQAIPLISTDGLMHEAMVAVPLFTESGAYPLQLRWVDSSGAPQVFEYAVQVISGGYPTANLSISAEMEALLAPAVEDFEITMLRNLTTPFTPERYHSGTLGLPAAAAMNAPFGTRRSYNGGAVNRVHNGADFASAPGTPVFAAGAGQVVLADLLNIRGNTIVIDHGWGLYTLYAHQNTLNVRIGDRVEAGQVIGTAGSTGRVTGPHLHWEVWVNGVAVDPIQWTQASFP